MEQKTSSPINVHGNLTQQARWKLGHLVVTLDDVDLLLNLLTSSTGHRPHLHYRTEHPDKRDETWESLDSVEDIARLPKPELSSLVVVVDDSFWVLLDKRKASMFLDKGLTSSAEYSNMVDVVLRWARGRRQRHSGITNRGFKVFTSFLFLACSLPLTLMAVEIYYAYHPKKENFDEETAWVDQVSIAWASAIGVGYFLFLRLISTKGAIVYPLTLKELRETHFSTSSSRVKSILQTIAITVTAVGVLIAYNTK
ncbi:hypothetical protein ACFFQW_07430 [Umezawaea endophytica]|uniref:Uncharacterized protein n=1 Tax=Umezawaea endophytica TaxID=1654476 RepID=A0A9X2VP10_9PSEU|nr:hypothetical protein [Umezawaea endophytica]MCS7480071.1 hypothetical protein [Umezawaea endophytica]